MDAVELLVLPFQLFLGFDDNLLGAFLFVVACGGKETVASKSAAAFREAQKKGIPVGGEARLVERHLAGSDQARRGACDGAFNQLRGDGVRARGGCDQRGVPPAERPTLFPARATSPRLADEAASS